MSLRASGRAGWRPASRPGRVDPCWSDPPVASSHWPVFQGMSQQARDGATRAELEAVAEAAIPAWPPGAPLRLRMS
ncbi:hypothetical protein [Streptomyces sp. NPDC001415]